MNTSENCFTYGSATKTNEKSENNFKITFSGTEGFEQYRTFFHYIKLGLLTFDGKTDSHKVGWTAQHLRGTAITWFEELDEEVLMDYKQFIIKFQEKFEPTQFRREAAMKWCDLYQKGTVEEYIKEFNCLSSEMPQEIYKMKEFMIDKFRHGLRHDQAAMWAQMEEDLRKCQQLLLERYRNELPTREINQIQSATNIAAENHEINKIKSRKNSKNACGRNKKCFTCGKVGHISSQCYKNRNRNESGKDRRGYPNRNYGGNNGFNKSNKRNYEPSKQDKSNSSDDLFGEN